jgi:lipase chaperone LimK
MMYRRMLKSMMTVFNGDYEMFHRARIEVRHSIESQSHITDVAEVNELLFQYEESRRVLLKSVY